MQTLVRQHEGARDNTQARNVHLLDTADLDVEGSWRVALLLFYEIAILLCGLASCEVVGLIAVP